MKSKIVAPALLLCLLLTGVTASAKVRSRTVAVSQDFSVGGTLVKSGIYLFSFDDKTNELTIAENGKRDVVVARASARAESRPAAASSTDIQLAKQGDAMVLTGVTFAGEKYNISVGQTTTASARE
jgi:hypothetical protein